MIGTDFSIYLRDHDLLLRLYAQKQSRATFAQCMKETRSEMRRVLYRDLLFYVDYVNNCNHVSRRYRDRFRIEIVPLPSNNGFHHAGMFQVRATKGCAVSTGNDTNSRNQCGEADSHDCTDRGSGRSDEAVRGELGSCFAQARAQNS